MVNVLEDDNITLQEIQGAEQLLRSVDIQSQARQSLQKLGIGWLFSYDMLSSIELEHTDILKTNLQVREMYVSVVNHAIKVGKELISNLKKIEEYEYEPMHKLLAEIFEGTDHLSRSSRGWAMSDSQRSQILERVFGVKESKA